MEIGDGYNIMFIGVVVLLIMGGVHIAMWIDDLVQKVRAKKARKGK